jgi:replicative DNA helicase
MKNKKQNSFNPHIEIPSDSNLEEIVLGSILLDKYALDKVIGDFSSNLFFSFKNKNIADCIISLYKQSLPVDIVTLTKELQKSEKLSSVGGPSYISTLTSKVASSLNIEYHIKILQEEALKRSLIRVLHKTFIT